MEPQNAATVSSPGGGGNTQVATAGGQLAGNVNTQQGSQATPQGEQTQTPQGGGEAQPQVKEVNVPLNVLQTVETKLKDANTKVQSLEAQIQQLNMLRNMGGFQPAQQQPVQQPVQTQQPASGGEDPFSGIEDDDLINAKDLKKIVQAIRPAGDDVNKAIAPINEILARLQVQIEDPNYAQTLQTYLPEMINSQPLLREMIARSPNPLQAALAVARMSPKFIQAQAASRDGGNGGNGGETQQPPDALSDLQKIIDNATKVGNPASMGGSGAVSGYDRFKTMSDADFELEVQRVLGGTSYGQ